MAHITITDVYSSQGSLMDVQVTYGYNGAAAQHFSNRVDASDYAGRLRAKSGFIAQIGYAGLTLKADHEAVWDEAGYVGPEVWDPALGEEG